VYNRSIYIAILFFFAQSAVGQAWTRESGSVYTKLFYGQTPASEQFAFDGTLRPYAENVENNAYVDQSIYLYAEVGITDAVTFFTTIPYKRITVRDASFKYQTQGAGSANVGLSISINHLTGWQSARSAASVSFLSSIPLGYTRNFAPSAGSGQVDFGALLSFGRSLYPAPFYFQASGGYEHKTSIYSLSSARDCQVGQDLNCVTDLQPDFDDQFLFSGEIGANLGRRILLQALVGGVWSIEAPTTGFSVYNPFPSRQRYLKTGAGIRLELPGQVGVGGQIRYTPIGANTIKSVDYFVGIDITFRIKKCCKQEEDASKQKKKVEAQSTAVPFSKPHQRRY
jgi:hypothetical protein